MSLRIHECLWRDKAWVMNPGCVSIIFCFWLSVNSLSFPVNDYSEGWWRMANVGVHSYILSTKRASVFCGSVVRAIFFSQRWYRWATLSTFFVLFHVSVACFFLRLLEILQNQRWHHSVIFNNSLNYHTSQASHHPVLMPIKLPTWTLGC